ncbi:hypothetical protein SR1949_52390 [Sphaerospermopsis reniformis]|uniref:Uncharacterized protein n=1 Tax=Sphaerospermopsis reniformis TaxID=531300 RepID=A0A480A532_9CYAN|nr:hypothetical protein SR1949_52390 [Sphaerospermopsis reniformis]
MLIDFVVHPLATIVFAKLQNQRTELVGVLKVKVDFDNKHDIAVSVLGKTHPLTNHRKQCGAYTLTIFALSGSLRLTVL